MSAARAALSPSVASRAQRRTVTPLSSQLVISSLPMPPFTRSNTDVERDFEPIVLLASSPLLIVSRNGVPAKDLKQLIAWMRSNNAKVSQAHNGIGGTMHLCGLDMQKRASAQWQIVPYRGAAPALQDMMAEQIDVICTLPGSGLGLVRSGKLKAYAVAANTRLAAAPEI